MKRLLCGVMAIALLFVFAACQPGARSAQGAADPSPVSSTSRGEDKDPVKVTETHPDAASPAPTEPAPSSNAAPAPTPDTGDIPIVPLAGAIGLILLCSAGLLMLRRI